MKKQITVYRVVRDPAYKQLVPVDGDAFEAERSKSWAFDGELPRSEWVELEMKPSDDRLKTPDIWEIVPGAFALEQQAYYELCSSAEETQQGYMNSLRCEGRKLAVINSAHCPDCLIEDESVFVCGNRSKIKKYVFDGEQLAVSLFKIPQTKQTELFTLDGFDEDNDFKTLVEKFGFTGVIFEPLWTGESFMNA